MSKEALSTDAKGNCELSQISIYPVSTADDEDCSKNYPELEVKIISVNKDELDIYFSIDGGETYYNEDNPRRAIRIQGYDDADGTNSSGGSSSKGGKKGTNDDRRKLLVEKTLKQAQRKLGLFNCIGWYLGDTCDWGCDPTNLECYRYNFENICVLFVDKLGSPCDDYLVRCKIGYCERKSSESKLTFCYAHAHTGERCGEDIYYRCSDYYEVTPYYVKYTVYDECIGGICVKGSFMYPYA
jgi:hypothetical protein